MKTIRIKIGKDKVGIIRLGYTGAKTLLVDYDGKFCLQWIGSNGLITEEEEVKEGRWYVVGPNFYKEVPDPEKDTYWPRKWAAQNKVSHKSYFIITDGNTVLEVINDKESYIPCPVRLQKVTIQPNGNFPFVKCIVNKKWLKTASWNEFLEEMETKSIFIDLRRSWATGRLL